MVEMMKQLPVANAAVEFYWTSMTPHMKIKKDVQATRFLLTTKKCRFEDYDLCYDDEKKLDMEEKSGKGPEELLPQIFINKKFIGGYDELEALEEAGKLDEMLAELPPDDDDDDLGGDDDDDLGDDDLDDDLGDDDDDD